MGPAFFRIRGSEASCARRYFSERGTFERRWRNTAIGEEKGTREKVARGHGSARQSRSGLGAAAEEHAGLRKPHPHHGLVERRRTSELATSAALLTGQQPPHDDLMPPYRGKHAAGKALTAPLAELAACPFRHFQSLARFSVQARFCYGFRGCNGSGLCPGRPCTSGGLIAPARVAHDDELALKVPWGSIRGIVDSTTLYFAVAVVFLPKKETKGHKTSEIPGEYKSEEERKWSSCRFRFMFARSGFFAAFISVECVRDAGNRRRGEWCFALAKRAVSAPAN